MNTRGSISHSFIDLSIYRSIFTSPCGVRCSLVATRIDREKVNLKSILAAHAHRTRSAAIV